MISILQSGLFIPIKRGKDLFLASRHKNMKHLHLKSPYETNPGKTVLNCYHWPSNKCTSVKFKDHRSKTLQFCHVDEAISRRNPKAALKLKTQSEEVEDSNSVFLTSEGELPERLYFEQECDKVKPYEKAPLRCFLLPGIWTCCCSVPRSQDAEDVERIIAFPRSAKKMKSKQSASTGRGKKSHVGIGN